MPPVIGGLGGLPIMSAPSMPTPTSGVVTVNSTGVHLHASLTVTVNPTVLAAATVTVELSQDGNAWMEYAKVGTPVGVSLAGTIHQLYVTVPDGWSYRVTAVNASLNSWVCVG